MKASRKKGERKTRYLKKVWDVSEVTTLLASKGFVVMAIADEKGCTIVAQKGDKRSIMRIEYGKLVLTA